MSHQNPEAPEAPSPSVLLLPEEVAERFRISTNTLARWRSTGTGPAVHRLGRRIRYQAADVEAFLAAGRHAPSAA